MAKKPRNYSREYKNYGSKHIHETARRVQARRDYEAKHGDQTGHDVHHVKPLSKGGHDDLSNLKAVSVHKNRAFKRDKNRKPSR